MASTGRAARQGLFTQGLAHWSVVGLIVLTLVVLDQREVDGGAAAPRYLLVGWGLLCGLLLSHILHEWGHYLGAACAGAAAPVRARLHPLFFDFDFARNTPRQFLWMSAGGLLGNLSLLLLVLTLSTAPLLGAGLLAAVAGQLVFVLVLELPVSLAVRAGGDPLESLSGHFQQGGPLFLRAGLAGLGTAAAILLLRLP